MVSCPCMSVTRSRRDGSTWHCARAGSIRAARVTGPALVEHGRHGHLAKTLIADVPDQVGIGELLGLDHRVQRAGRVEAEVAHRERLHQVEHDERGDALPVRRDLADLPAPIRRRDGLHPFDVEVGQVLRVHRAAARLEHGHDGLRRRAPVVAVASALGDSRERPGKVRVAEDRCQPPGTRPSTRNVRAALGSASSTSSERAQRPAVTSATGNPSLA